MNSIRFKLLTGGDDLRGDSLLEALIVFSDGSTLRATLHQPGTSGWDNDTSHTTPDINVAGKPTVTHIVLLFNQGGGGLNGDNWNMQAIEVFADGTEDFDHTLFSAVGQREDDTCVHRFKGHHESGHDSPDYEFKPRPL